MRLIKLLAVFSSLVVIGCAGQPQKPDIDLCLHNLPHKEAWCEGTVNHDRQSVVPMDLTDNWIMLSPRSWHGLETYIDSLIAWGEKSGRITSDEAAHLRIELKSLQSQHLQLQQSVIQ